MEVWSRQRKERGRAVERETWVIKVVRKEKKKKVQNICWNHEQLFTGTLQFVDKSMKKFSSSVLLVTAHQGYY